MLDVRKLGNTTRKKRILYYNLTYECNNDCVFCFSHNTNCQNNSEVNLQDVELIKCYRKITCKDRVVINGGEPLMCTDLLPLISFFKKKTNEVVLYSNGRLLKKCEYAEEIIKAGLARITIPVHGDSCCHDCLTRRNGSYGETVTGINNMLYLKKGYGIKLELKIIITTMLIKAGINLLQYLENELIISDVDCIVIAGMVQTRKSVDNGVEVANIRNVAAYAERMILFAKKNTRS